MRRPAAFAAPETGTFIHYVLEHALTALGKREGGAAAAGKDAVARACREAVDQYIREELGGLQTRRRASAICSGGCKSVQQILDNVIEELRVSEFRPIDYEVISRAAVTCRPSPASRTA